MGGGIDIQGNPYDQFPSSRTGDILQNSCVEIKVVGEST